MLLLLFIFSLACTFTFIIELQYFHIENDIPNRFLPRTRFFVVKENSWIICSIYK